MWQNVKNKIHLLIIVLMNMDGHLFLLCSASVHVDKERSVAIDIHEKVVIGKLK